MTTENVQYWKDAHALLLEENKKLKEDLDATTIALDIVKAENEVNKKNAIMKVGKLFKKNKDLKTELEDVKDDISVMHGEDEVQELIMEISDLKEEAEENKKLFDITSRFMDENTKLKEENKNIQKYALAYWSDNQLGDCDAWMHPLEWQEQLEALDNR